MKKFLVAALVLGSFSALADNKHMVTLSGYETGTDARSLDLAYGHGSQANYNNRNLALNYAYAVTDAWQVGARLKDKNNSQGKNTWNAGDRYTQWGVQVIHNFSNRLSNTNYLALQYDMKSSANASDGTGGGANTSIWGLEFGHRFSLGDLWGMNFNWSPSILGTRSSVDYKTSGVKTSNQQAFTFNVLKVDVLF